ncbi:universal stress protein [Streptomyces sp. MS1.AVA.1]|uniref:Universal stress protein n=1 Tax=Streptomyces machairae TaxID=3134109 RepID=A0ABU8UHS1_9ACTN
MSGSGSAATARVVVGVSGSVGSLTALRRAADEARRRGAELWPVPAWRPPGGDPVARRGPGVSLMHGKWQRLARERLVAVLGDVFGETGPGVWMYALVARGTPGRRSSRPPTARRTSWSSAPAGAASGIVRAAAR